MPAIAKKDSVDVELVAPTNGALYTAPAGISVSARAQEKQSNHPIVKVDFFAGGNLIGTAVGPQAGDAYTMSWADVPAGIYAVTAVATNDKGDTDTSDPVTITVNAPPSVRITAPANDAVFNEPGAFTIAATASDPDGAIAKVEIYEGQTLLASLTSAPYAVALSGLAPGSYTFTALATDDRGAHATSAALALRVNALPSVSLTSPANSAAFRAPATVPIEALVSDSDGSIARVEFYYGSTLIATLNAAPYTFSWTGVPQGTYALTARAVDDLGATVSSTAVEISVAAGQAQLFYVHVDHLNTPRLVADANGAAVWRWDQDEPFANNTADEHPNGSGAFDLPLRLPGQYFDRETALYYNYYRTYDPSSGTYRQSDPVGLQGGVNTYAYVDARPLNFSDPYGLDRTIWLPGPGRSIGDGPRNGNWCGGNWSGGQVPSLNGGKDGASQPTDSLDRCCMAHDKCYGGCEKIQEKNARKACMIACDRGLVGCLKSIDDDCTKWPEVPRQGTEADSQIYRDDATRHFSEEIRKWERKNSRRP